MLVPIDDLWDKDDPRRPKADECLNCTKLKKQLGAANLIINRLDNKINRMDDLLVEWQRRLDVLDKERER